MRYSSTIDSRQMVALCCRTYFQSANDSLRDRDPIPVVVRSWPRSHAALHSQSHIQNYSYRKLLEKCRKQSLRKTGYGASLAELFRYLAVSFRYIGTKP